MISHRGNFSCRLSVIMMFETYLFPVVVGFSGWRMLVYFGGEGEEHNFCIL